MSLTGVDLNLLVALDALLAERSVTRAAERVGLSQPGMSNTLARLRKLFGDPLLVREGLTLVPTPRAESLRQPIQEALSLIQQALDDRPVRRHLTSVYVLSGLTGMVFYIRLGAGAPSSGDGFELTAIAAVVIGGVSLFGAVERLTGTILGALILTVVTSGLIISNVSPNWNQVAVALCIAAAASLQALRPSNRRQS